MYYFKILQLVLSLLPQIIEVVSTVEQMFGGQKGVGSAKLDAVKSLVKAAFDASNRIGVTFDAAWPAIQNIITAVVDLKNKTGQFETTGPKPTPRAIDSPIPRAVDKSAEASGPDLTGA